MGYVNYVTLNIFAIFSERGVSLLKMQALLCFFAKLYLKSHLIK